MTVRQRTERVSFHRPIGSGRGIRRLAAAPDLVEFKLLGKFVIGMEALESALVQERTAAINATEKAAALLLEATFRIWSLALNRQTPDTIGMKRHLDERYGHSTDDIPHADLFSEAN